MSAISLRRAIDLSFEIIFPNRVSELPPRATAHKQLELSVNTLRLVRLGHNKTAPIIA